MKGTMKIPKTDYAQISKYYDKVRNAEISAWVSRIVELGCIKRISLVLDVGCGTGRFPLSILAQTKATIASIDLSKDMLRKAVKKPKAKRVFWAQADGQRLPFRENCFDCVYMTLVLHHYSDKVKGLKELHRVLKRNGKCIIVTQSHSKIRKHIISNFPKISAIDLKRFPSIPFTIDVMNKIGFTKVKTRRIERKERRITLQDYLEKVRNKYLSTLTLLTDKEFQKGMTIFKRKVKAKYGDKIQLVSGFNFIVGEK
jgi:SAM-dependent methyltransferase